VNRRAARATASVSFRAGASVGGWKELGGGRRSFFLPTRAEGERGGPFFRAVRPSAVLRASSRGEGGAARSCRSPALASQVARRMFLIVPRRPGRKGGRFLGGEGALADGRQKLPPPRRRQAKPRAKQTPPCPSPPSRPGPSSGAGRPSVSRATDVHKKMRRAQRPTTKSCARRHTRGRAGARPRDEAGKERGATGWGTPRCGQRGERAMTCVARARALKCTCVRAPARARLRRREQNTIPKKERERERQRATQRVPAPAHAGGASPPPAAPPSSPPDGMGSYPPPPPPPPCCCCRLGGSLRRMYSTHAAGSSSASP